MRFPSNKTLAKVAIYIAFGSISSIMCMRWIITERIRNADYFQEAFKILRQHRGAISILGEPIREMGFDIHHPDNCCNDEEVKLAVSVRGSKERGKLFFSATNKDDSGWLIDSLQLELKSQPDTRYLIKSDNNGTQSFNKD